MNLFESTFKELYDSTVLAFPRTQYRQHATQPIVIESLRWIPYQGIGTLYIKGFARNENRYYEPMILFKNVHYPEFPTRDSIKVETQFGEAVFDKLSLKKNDILVRCQCGDFRWRMAFYDHIDHSLYGKKPKKYESKGIGPPANPKEMPGMCKHILRLFEALDQLGIFND